MRPSAFLAQSLTALFLAGPLPAGVQLASPCGAKVAHLDLAPGQSRTVGPVLQPSQTRTANVLPFVVP